MEKVHEEMAYLIKRWNIEYICFYADTFLAWTESEFNAFIEMYRKFKLPFWMQTRPETITEERVEKLKSVNCHRVSIGIEHGNEKFRREMLQRRISNEELIKRTNLVGSKIPISVNNITGFPTETRELAFDTIRLNREFRVDAMNCFTFTPYHGARLRQVALDLGLLDAEAATADVTADSILDQPQYPREEIRKVVKTFSLYARLPESEWPRIKKAEEDTEEGRAIFMELRNEYINRYFNDSKPTFS